VILVDVNLLLHAGHPRAEQHEESRAWLEAVLWGPDLVRFSWLTLWAFLWIATNPRVFKRPLSTTEAEAAISSWLDQAAAGLSTRANGTGTSCAALCATDKLPVRWSWTPSSPQSRSNMALRSVQRIATSRGVPGSNGQTPGGEPLTERENCQNSTLGLFRTLDLGSLRGYDI
jgi:hypothetical protein